MIKSVGAGLFVVLLSVLSNTFQPKFFAGLFASAPSVATIGLLLAGLSQPHKPQPKPAG